MHLLFVCTGNICRSPIAERLSIAYAERLQVPDFTASSAGTRAMIGHPIEPDAAVVLQQLGGEAGNFAARLLTSRIALEADLILTMSRAHRDAVLEFAPRQLHRTFTLGAVARLVTEFDAQSIDDLAALRPQVATPESLDVADPIGRGVEVHKRVGSQIADLLQPVLELCLHLSSQRGD